jgi:hypothetical protein
LPALREAGTGTPSVADDPWAGEDARWASEDASSAGDDELIRPARGIALAVVAGAVAWVILIALLLSVLP